MDFTSSGGHIFPSLNMNIKVSNCIIFVLFLTLSTSAHRSRRFLTFPRTQPTQISLISGIGIPVSMLEIESVTIGYVFKAQFFLPENASNYLNPLNDPFDLTPQPISGMNRKRRFLDGEQPTESPQQNDDGFDSEQNERYERHEVRADVIERGTKASDVEEIIDNGPWIDQESGFSDDPRALKTPQYLGTSRFSLYKSIAAVADRFVKFFEKPTEKTKNKVDFKPKTNKLNDLNSKMWFLLIFLQQRVVR